MGKHTHRRQKVAISQVSLPDIGRLCTLDEDPVLFIALGLSMALHLIYSYILIVLIDTQLGLHFIELRILEHAGAHLPVLSKCPIALNLEHLLIILKLDALDLFHPDVATGLSLLHLYLPHHLCLHPRLEPLLIPFSCLGQELPLVFIPLIDELVDQSLQLINHLIKLELLGIVDEAKLLIKLTVDVLQFLVGVLSLHDSGGFS